MALQSVFEVPKALLSFSSASNAPFAHTTRFQPGYPPLIGVDLSVDSSRVALATFPTITRLVLTPSPAVL